LSPDDQTSEASADAPPRSSPVIDRSPASRGLAPGAILSGRYRIVALLGRGGMGDVYRADDLTLDQPVALKFLPAASLADPARLARFHNELRTARQVSHRNVCRVYDFGEADGHRFLSMEYVDGEDLAVLLRRIGRIPHDKAVQIARQLCAGVAAAHERGVLHRDLKPANVMIDGRGDVRITDFGIATASGDATGELVGTLRYMAPEQFEGAPATVASDIYALGLMLFEIFTGRHSHEWTTVEELRRFHRTGTHVTPSTLVRDLDPAVERIIERCLNRDPGQRPTSALAVAHALPGGDALADALAAGETPSPALLAAAGETQALRALPGVLMALAATAGMLLFAWGVSQVSILGRAPLERPPEVLIDRARELLRSLGYQPGRDEAHDFRLNGEYLFWVERTRRTPDRWAVLPTAYPSPLRFWYRASAHAMRPSEGLDVTLEDPPLLYGEMRSLVFDSTGRLIDLRVLPPRVEEPSEHTTNSRAAVAPPWSLLFAAAGLDEKAFAQAASQWTPLAYADVRQAWEGPMPGRPDQRVRIEAASYRGRPVAFEVVGPWTFPDGVQPPRNSRVDRWLLSIIAAGIVAFVATAVVLARRHLRTGRADVRGATRLAIYSGAAMLASLPLQTHGAWVIDEAFVPMFRSASRVVLLSLLLWIMYVGLESYVRRFWPHALLGWSRLLSGRVRDARVGRDVLTGVVFGVTLTLVDLGRAVLLPWAGYPAPWVTFSSDTELLSSAGLLAARWLTAAAGAVQYALLAVLIMVVLRLASRWQWLASGAAALCLSVATWNHMFSSSSWLFGFALVSGGLLTFVAARFGLLTLAVTWFVWSVLYTAPLTLDTHHWSATASNWTLALVLMLTLFGFVTARAGQPLPRAVEPPHVA
jgi:hypothetical protein